MGQFMVHTSCIFDPKAKQFRPNISITVDSETGLITRVFERGDDEKDGLAHFQEGDVDLRGKVVLPGLVDAHTHVFLHSYKKGKSVHVLMRARNEGSMRREADALKQKRDESIVERVVRGVNHCRAALMAGYTTYRDLGTEGMQDFDANLRDAINRGLTAGPRLFVSTRIIASTGSVEGRTENTGNGHCLPTTSDAVDGVDECRKAVRRRIAAGADIIKVFVDYRRRIMRYPPKQQHPYVPGVLSPPQNPNPDYLVFSQHELNAIVEEAKLAGCPVAAHATTLRGGLMAIEAGVDTIEHALAGEDEMWKKMVEHKTILVPTMAAVEGIYPARAQEHMQRVKRAYDLGVRLACGGDTGTFPHGDNVREIELFVRAGIPLADVLEICTVGGWEASGGDRCGRRFGWFEEGLQADMIAVDEHPDKNIGALRHISFVMKDAKVWKREGKPVDLHLN